MGHPTEKFLEKYREVESLMAQCGCPDGFRGAEDDCDKTGDVETKSYLRMCRLMRNFAVHTPGGADFLESERVREQYLESLKQSYVARLDTVSKHMDRGTRAICRTTDAVSYVLECMAQKKVSHMLVVDAKTKIAQDVVDIYELTFAQRTAGTKVAAVLAKRKPRRLACVAQTCIWADVPDADVVFVTKDGSCGSPVIGIVRKKESRSAAV